METKKLKFPEWCTYCKHKDDPTKPATQSKPNSYYDAGGISTIEVIRAKLTPEQYKGFCLGNAIKYALRMEHKGSPESDSKKLWDYAGWLSNHYHAEKD